MPIVVETVSLKKYFTWLSEQIYNPLIFSLIYFFPSSKHIKIQIMNL
jgi:hypothetical protein